MTALALPPLRAPFTGGDPHAALRDARGVIEDAIVNHPRSLQRTIGPSEIGTPCEHCLAAKLAGWDQVRDVAWLPTIGTALHAWVEEAFIAHENRRGAQHDGGLRYLTEAKVMVGTILGQEIWGSTDLLDVATGMTVDWKLVGAATLRKAKTGPSPVYRTQADLYAKGWNDAGVRVDHVAIAYLPRNAVSLDDAIWWTAPHDRQRAVDALARAERIATNLAALTALGPDAVAAWISGLPRDPDCFDCARFPDGAHLTPPGHRAPAAQFADLLGSTAA
ncbi:hypothetical protein [Cellulomonas sp. RIT-PI-Y]|uniref:hypothetical protein n=1 Tax=Cellulomonas sp. RIT-PI-Y TaxID=3035297 RepID=UPI0021D7F402|nr:hypothetical protein [Cellulomonas sp. RIT-PI-Y]